MPFDADDLAAFNDADMPGYAQAVIGGVEVNGRFREEYVEASGIAGRVPTFSAPAASLSAVVFGAAVAVGGEDYEVVAIERPAQAQPHHTRLILELAA